MDLKIFRFFDALDTVFLHFFFFGKGTDPTACKSVLNFMIFKYFIDIIPYMSS